jgi:hypothetical protein
MHLRRAPRRLPAGPQACLLENPKSYSTWHHRKWVVLKGYADLAAELKLVGRCARPRSPLEWQGRASLAEGPAPGGCNPQAAPAASRRPQQPPKAGPCTARFFASPLDRPPFCMRPPLLMRPQHGLALRARLCRAPPRRSALEQDGRNFHAWAYRQFVVKLSSPGVTTEDELAYAGARIAADFSNYSAWHYRTILLHKLYCEEVQTGEARARFRAGQGSCCPGARALNRRGAGAGKALVPLECRRATVCAGSGHLCRPPSLALLPLLPAARPALALGPAHSNVTGTPRPAPAVSFEDLLADKAPAVSSSRATGGGGGGASDVRGAFSGTAGQRRPVPVHVLDQEYDLVHQVGLPLRPPAPGGGQHPNPPLIRPTLITVPLP